MTNGNGKSGSEEPELVLEFTEKAKALNKQLEAEM